jgi:hypothetical protein
MDGCVSPLERGRYIVKKDEILAKAIPRNPIKLLQPKLFLLSVCFLLGIYNNLTSISKVKGFFHKNSNI